MWTTGRGAPVLMIPGGPFVAASLAPLAAALAPNHTVHMLERPGVGGSPAVPLKPSGLFEYARLLVQDTLEALELDAVTLLGNSLGGTIAILHAVAQPQTVTKLILVSPPGGIDREVPRVLELLSRRVLGKLILLTLGRPSLQATRGMFAAAMVAHIDRVPADLIELQTRAHQLPGAWMAWRDVIRALVDPKGLRAEASLFEVLPRVSVPTSMIWGGLDQITPPSRGEAAMRTIPGLDLRIIADAGHLMWIDQEQATLDVLREQVSQPAQPDR